MKNQFFGDVNDYFKYGLIRILAGKGEKKIGVCWMLTPDDGTHQGSRTGYLDYPHKWRRFDPQLFDCLKQIVRADGVRNVWRVERAKLLPSAIFYGETLADHLSQRQDYFKEMLQRFAEVDIIFFDPDVGLEVQSKQIGRKGSSKYLYWEEVSEAFKQGHSLLIFQFFPFKKRSEFVQQKAEEIWQWTNAGEIFSFPTPNVVFFFAAQKRDLDYFRRQAERVKEVWAKKIEVLRHSFSAQGIRSPGTRTHSLPGAGRNESNSIYFQRPLRLDRVRTYPLRSRPSKISISDFARVPSRRASVREWTNSLPRILAGESFRGVISALQKARGKKKPIIWGLGGHVIKVGIGPVLIDLMERGYLTAVAMNGAALIHDFEVALVGATSEDVPEALGRGRFGMAEETGRYINEAIAAGDQEGLGIGEAVGRFLVQHRGARFRQYSLLAHAYQRRVPVTVHQAIGTDIIHNHPAIDPRALGAASHRDFRLLATLVRKLSGGGVYLNVGSAVVLPEVFLKCVSLASNLGHPPRGITTVNLDFIQHYRPTQNVLLRPTAATRRRGERGLSHGYALTGHHELMIPLLAAALNEGRRGR